MSLSRRATCRILSGHKESTSLFEAAEGVGQRRWQKKVVAEGVRQKKVAEKVAAAGIVGKANPEGLGVFLGERVTGKERGDSQREGMGEAMERVRGVSMIV